MVPAKRQGSCRIIVILDRRSFKLYLEISLPSKTIVPESASNILKRHNIMVDFPEPVLPTTPILCPPWKVTVSPLKTKSKFFLYLHLKSVKSILPVIGHPSFLSFLRSRDLIFCTYLSFRYTRYPCSGGKSINCSQREMEISSFSKVLKFTYRKYII